MDQSKDYHSVAAEYGIQDGIIVGNTISGVADLLSARFLFNTASVDIEKVLLDWSNEAQAISDSHNALVPFGFFTRTIDRDPANVEHLRAIFAKHRAAEAEFLARLMGPKIVLPEYKILPLLMSMHFVSKCNDGTQQEQLDCEQYEFLKALGLEFPRTVPVQFDFETWSSLMDEFIYQKTDFQFIRIISSYGSSKSMFRDFALDALTQGKKVGAIPGSPLSQAQKEKLDSPIVWPVWSQDCLARNEFGKIQPVNTRCISYELYVPSDYIMEKLSGAVFGGRKMNLKITKSIGIGPNGQLLQLDTEVKGHVHQLSTGSGELTINYENKQVNIDTEGAIATISVEQGDVINFGNIGGKFVMDVKAGKYESIGGALNAVDQGVLIAQKGIAEYPLRSSDGRIMATAKNTLACGGDDCVLYRQSAGDIKRFGTQGVIQGDSVILSGGNIMWQTLHENREVHEFEGNTRIVRTEFKTFRAQEFATGQLVMRADGKFIGRGIAAFAEQGGVIAGRAGTDLRAMTSLGEYFSKTVKYHTLSKHSVTVEALVTHTSLVEVEAGSPDTTLAIGDSDTPTVIEGLVMLGGENGPGLIIRGGKGSALLEHLIPSSMSVTMKRSGLIKGRIPRFAMKDANLLRNIESLGYNDWLGFTTGVITDAVSAHRTFGKVKTTLEKSQFIKDLSIASGVAVLTALFGHCVRAGVSFGREITVISSEGVSSVPNQIGKDRSFGDSESGVLGIYINSDYRMEHMKVNLQKIDKVILGQLTLKPGTNRLTRTVNHQSDTVSFDISLSGLSLMTGTAEMNQEDEQLMPQQSSFFGQEVIVVVNDRLEIEGTIIDGQQVKVETPEVLVQNVLEKIRNKTDSVSFGVGVAIGWDGQVLPAFNIGGEKGVKDSCLAKFVSGITGERVEIVANRIVANLDQITARGELLMKGTRIDNSNNPKPTGVSHKTWSAQASLGQNIDGSLNPSLFASYTRNEVRTSVHLSLDLFTGLKAISKWLDRAFKTLQNSVTVEPGNSHDTKIAEPESKQFAKKYQARQERVKVRKQRMAEAEEGLKANRAEMQEEYEALEPNKKKIFDEFQKFNEAVLHRAREDTAFARSDLGVGDADQLEAITTIAESARELEAKHLECKQKHPELAELSEQALNLNMHTLASYAPETFDYLSAKLTSLGITPDSSEADLRAALNKLQSFIHEHDTAVYTNIGSEISREDSNTLASMSVVLEALNNANSAYEPDLDTAAGKIREHKNYEISKIFNDPWNGARANIAEKINLDGSKDPVYNAAGTESLKVSLKEAFKDLPADIAVWISVRAMGKLVNGVLAGSRLLGEGLDRTDSETFTSDPAYQQYVQMLKGWDQIPDQVFWHIKNMEEHNKVSGNRKPFIINGHSLGGSLGLIILTLRPDLVKVVNAIDPPGSYQMLRHILSNDQLKIAQVYNKVNIYNAKPGQFPNSIGELPAGIKVHAIGSDSHSLDSIIDAYKKHGSVEVGASAYNHEAMIDFENKALRVIVPVYTTKEDIAQKFNVPIEHVLWRKSTQDISTGFKVFNIKLKP